MAIGNTTSITGRKIQGGASGRSRQTVKRLAMQRTKAVRDKDGNILYQAKQSKTPQLDGRIAPNRKWFANTRTVTQKELDAMREVTQRQLAGNQILVKDKRLPTDLVRDLEVQQPHVVDLMSFQDVFGQKSHRIRPLEMPEDAASMLAAAQAECGQYSEKNDSDTLLARREREERRGPPADARLSRGATSRVHSEVYKVIDSADVICYVLDARDPAGTRSHYVESYLKAPENQHRHLIYILNKVDLVPLWATRSWIQVLQKEHPIIAYQASARRPYGRAELISVLRQFSRLHSFRPNISVAFLGMPNVGKSSVINSLVGEQPCKVAPVPGETKIWQFVNLTKKIFLIDSPGVIFGSGVRDENQEDVGSEEGGYGIDAAQVLRGAIRVEYVEYPERLVPVLLNQVRPEHIRRTYGIGQFNDPEELLELLAFKLGRLLPGGAADKRSVARRLIEDFVRGKLPHFKAAWDVDEAEKYREAHKLAIQTAQQEMKRQNDSELIKFVNRQKLEAAGQEFKYLNEDLTEREKLFIQMQEDEDRKLKELAKEAEKYGIGEDSEEDSENNNRLNAQGHGQAVVTGDFALQENSQSSVQGFSSAEVSAAMDESDEYGDQDENKRSFQNIRINTNKSDNEQNITQNIAGLRHTGTRRATRLLRTRNTELLRAAASGLVDEADLRRVVRDVKKRKKKQRQGGWSGAKTGIHFYEQKRSTGKR